MPPLTLSTTQENTKLLSEYHAVSENISQLFRRYCQTQNSLQHLIKKELEFSAQLLVSLSTKLKNLGFLTEGEKGLKKAIYILEKLDTGMLEANARNNLAVLLQMQQRYTEALNEFQKALILCERKEADKTSEATANILNGLGSALQNTGQYHKAIPYLRRALAIHQKLPGALLKTIKSMFFLAICLYETLSYPEAESLLLKILEIIEQNPSTSEFLIPALSQLGKISMLVGMSSPHLSKALKTHGDGSRLTKLNTALSCYQRLLYLEKEKPDTTFERLFDILGSLRVIAIEMGFYQKAESYAQELLALVEKRAASNQKLMLTAQLGLADALSYAPKYAEARDHYEQILRKISDSKETAYLTTIKHAAITGLAQVLDKMSLYEESEKYFRQLIDSLEKHQPEEKSMLAESLSNFAGLLLRVDKHKEGLEYCKRALCIYEESYGPESFHMSATYTNMGALFGNLKNYEASLDCHQKALRLYQRDFGESSIQVIMELGAIAYMYDEMGRDEEATQYYERALEMQKRFLGVEYAEKKSCILNNYALFLKRQKKYMLALEHYKQALILEKNISATSMGVTKILDGLGHLHMEIKNYTLAKKFYEKSLKIKRKIYPPYATEIGETLSNIAALDRIFSPENRFSRYQEAIRNYQQTGQDRHYSACSIRLKLAEEYIQSKLYTQAIQLLQEIVAINEGILSEEINNFSMDDLSSHIHLLNKLAKILVLNNQKLEAAKLFEQQSAIFEAHFRPITIYCLEQAIYYYKKISGTSAKRAELLIKKANKLDQYPNFMKPWQPLLQALAKANALMPTTETEKLLEKYQDKYEKFLMQVNHDLARQFSTAVNTYHELMRLYFFCEKDELPNSLQNKAMEIILAVCNILDQSYGRLLTQRVQTPNKKKLGDLYFPIAKSLEALKKILAQKKLLSENLSSNKTLHFLDQNCPQSYQAIIDAQVFSANTPNFLSGWLKLLFDLNNHSKHIGLVSQKRDIDLHQQMGTFQRASRRIEVVIKDEKIHFPIFLEHVFNKVWHLLQNFSQEMLPLLESFSFNFRDETSRLLITEAPCDLAEEQILSSRILNFNLQPTASHRWQTFQAYYLALVKLGYFYIRQGQWKKVGELYEKAGEHFVKKIDPIAIIFWKKAFLIYKNAALNPELCTITKKLSALYNAMGLRFKSIEMLEELEDRGYLEVELVYQLSYLKTKEVENNLMDRDILSQLQYAKNNFLTLRCAWINYLALSPQSTSKLFEIQNQLATLLVRARHILDQVFRRILDITVLEPNETSLLSAHGYNYPVCATEKKLQKKLKACHAVGNPPGFLNLSTVLYEIIKSAQPFSDLSPAEHWLSRLVALSNKAKHERQPTVLHTSPEVEEKTNIEEIEAQFAVEGSPRLIPLLDQAIVEIERIVKNCFGAITTEKKLLALPTPLNQYDLPKRVSIELPSLIVWLNTLTHANFFAVRDSDYYVDAIMQITKQREAHLARSIQSRLGFGTFFTTPTDKQYALFVLPKTNEENAEKLETSLRKWK